MFMSPVPAAFTRPGPRFLSFPLSTQLAILFTLRDTTLADGSLALVPAAEWLRLLRLVDPVIQPPTLPTETYRVADGDNLLRLLLHHYLDVT